MFIWNKSFLVYHVYIEIIWQWIGTVIFFNDPLYFTFYYVIKIVWIKGLISPSKDIYVSSLKYQVTLKGSK